ncbi:MAG: flippase activity-associated protein Agl23 [Chthoniobacterales bacterium]
MKFLLKLQKEKHWTRYLPFCILILAALLRLWALDLKPPHFDEGINGWFADRVKEQGFYAYDPTNYHGPLFFYILFLAQNFFGRSLWVLRMPAVLASITTVWLALRFECFLGKNAARWGALTLAVSPAMVFYGRYAIHESWVAASLMILLLGFFGLWLQGNRRSLFLTLLGLTLLILLKETAVIHVASLFLTSAVLFLWHRWSISKLLHPTGSTILIQEPKFPRMMIAKQSWGYYDLWIGILVSIAVIFFFYSGGLRNIRGFLNLFYTLPAWIHTGTSAVGHIKSTYQWGPFNYYWLALMTRYEAASLVGFGYALGLVIWRFFKSLFPQSTEALNTGSKNLFSRPNPATESQDPFFCFYYCLALYGLGAFVVYSIIPYKTPWCIISILWPFSLLFGVFLQHLNNKKVALALGSLLLGASLFLCMRLNFWHYVDFSEPYVYVQTSPEIKRLTEPLLTMAKKDPRNIHLRGQILLESYFPLPWILRDFTSIGYFSKTNVPKKYDGDVIVVELSRSPAIEKQLHEFYYRKEFQLRDAMGKCVVYFKKSVFEDFFGQHAVNTNAGYFR